MCSTYAENRVPDMYQQICLKIKKTRFVNYLQCWTICPIGHLDIHLDIQLDICPNCPIIFVLLDLDNMDIVQLDLDICPIVQLDVQCPIILIGHCPNPTLLITIFNYIGHYFSSQAKEFTKFPLS